MALDMHKQVINPTFWLRHCPMPIAHIQEHIPQSSSQSIEVRNTLDPCGAFQVLQVIYLSGRHMAPADLLPLVDSTKILV